MVKKKMMESGGNVPKQKSTRSRNVNKYTDGYKTVEKYKKRNDKIKSSDKLVGPGRDKSKTVSKYNESTGKGSKKNIYVKDGERTVDKYNYKTGGTVNPIKRAAKIDQRVLVDEARAKRKAAKQKAREEKKNIKAVNKNVRAKMEGYDSTKSRREARNADARKTIKAARTKKVKIEGDRRTIGNNSNSTTTITDNSTRSKSTSTSSQANPTTQSTNQAGAKAGARGGNSSSNAKGGKGGKGGKVDQSKGNNRNNRNSNNNNKRSLVEVKTGGMVNPNVGTKNMATPLLAKKGMDMGYNPMAKMGMAKKPSMVMSNKELMEYKKGATKKYKTGGMVNPNMGAKAKTPK